MPLIMELKEGDEESAGKKDGEERRKMIIRWDEEARQKVQGEYRDDSMGRWSNRRAIIRGFLARIEKYD